MEIKFLKLKEGRKKILILKQSLSRYKIKDKVTTYQSTWLGPFKNIADIEA